MSDKGTILIENHVKDFRRLSEAVDEELRSLEHEEKFERIHYDSIGHKYFTIANAITGFIIVGIFAGCFAFILKKIGFVISGYSSLLKLFLGKGGNSNSHNEVQNDSSASGALAGSAGTQTTIFSA